MREVIGFVISVVAFGPHAQSVSSTAAYEACVRYIGTADKESLGFDATPTKNICAALKPGGVCDPTKSGVNTQNSSDLTNSMGSPARCLGILYGLAAMGTMQFEPSEMNCGTQFNGAHNQCINMMNAICQPGPYLGSLQGSLCWWLLGLGSNSRTDIFLQGNSVNQAIQNVCYLNAGAATANGKGNPLIYSAVTGCKPQDVDNEAN